MVSGYCSLIIGPRREKTCLREFAKNKSADQTAQAQSDQRLCFSLFESIIFKLATCEFSTFFLVSVAEQAGLNLALSEIPKIGFLATRPN